MKRCRNNLLINNKNNERTLMDDKNLSSILLCYLIVINGTLDGTNVISANKLDRAKML